MSNSYSLKRTSATQNPHTMYRPQVPSCEQVYGHFKQAKKEFESTFSGLSFATMHHDEKEDAQNYIYRSQIIMAYSAFDLFMHEILYLGFSKMKEGKIKKSEEYKKFMAADIFSEQRFNEDLKETYGYVTLTTKDNWGNALTWLNFNPEEISKIYLEGQKESYEGSAFEALKKIIKAKSNRRNNLVHAYDFNIPGGTQSPITREKAEEFIRYISSLVNIVYERVKKEWN